MKTNPSHDDLIKRLLLHPRLLVEFFRAFLPAAFEFADFSRLEYLDKEHPRTKRRPRRTGDLLVKARWRDQDAAFLIHFESQGTPQQKIMERACEYAMRDSIRYDLPVMPVVLLTYTKPETPVSGRLDWKFGDLAAIKVRCPVLHFRRMDPRPHLRSHNVTALALSSLMKLDEEQQVDAIAETLAEALRQRLDSDEREDAFEFVCAYAELKARQFLQLERKVDKLASKETLLKPMPKFINPFIEIGKIHGREEGLSQGRLQGHVIMVMRQLQKKFPRVAKRASPLVRKLDEEGLLSFSEALLFMEGDAKCLSWLKERV